MWAICYFFSPFLFFHLKSLQCPYSSFRWCPKWATSFGTSLPGPLTFLTLLQSRSGVCDIYHSSPEAKWEVLGTRLIPQATHNSSDVGLTHDMSASQYFYGCNFTLINLFYFSLSVLERNSCLLSPSRDGTCLQAASTLNIAFIMCRWASS